MYVSYDTALSHMLTTVGSAPALSTILFLDYTRTRTHILPKPINYGTYRVVLLF
jgi:hypothetical protein